MIKLDFVKAFHAVLITSEEQPLYAFIGPDQNYNCYNVLPMGTRNSPALFSESMQKSLQDFQRNHEDEIRHYQDDIAICGTSPKSTIDLAMNVMEAMKLSGLTQILKNHTQRIQSSF
eukprot:GHVP01032056.1.p1 GENE.GHVP01032056.1~~GHVP01032056.1.p1  ORF type:complete len:117 (+),score=10.05 GHVP01032056.1:534-884(+)